MYKRNFDRSEFKVTRDISPTISGWLLVVKIEGLLKLTGSHVHWKSDNILETMLHRDVITTGH